MALDGISTVSPAMAMTLAMLPASPSIFTVTLAGCDFSRLWMAIPAKTSPPPLLMRTVRSATGPSAFSSLARSVAVTPQ